jgi:hypothetical protein
VPRTASPATSTSRRGRIPGCSRSRPTASRPSSTGSAARLPLDASFCSDCHQDARPPSHTRRGARWAASTAGAAICRSPIPAAPPATARWRRTRPRRRPTMAAAGVSPPTTTAELSPAARRHQLRHLPRRSRRTRPRRRPTTPPAGASRPTTTAAAPPPLADTSCAVHSSPTPTRPRRRPTTPPAGEPANSHSAVAAACRTTCATCHQSTPSHDQAPSSHAGTWGQPANEHCGSCHLPLADTSCATCHTDLEAHRQEAPRDTHRGGWGQPANNHCGSCHVRLPTPAAPPVTALRSRRARRRRRRHRTTSPGVAGSTRTATAATCRSPTPSARSATASRGHDTPPPSHDSSFNRAPTYGHRNSCHFPVSQESCAVCHRGDEHGPPMMPDWHDTISDCLYCHPSSEPTNHPLTDMETCLRCHSSG